MALCHSNKPLLACQSHVLRSRAGDALTVMSLSSALSWPLLKLQHKRSQMQAMQNNPSAEAQKLLSILMSETMYKIPKDKYITFWSWMRDKIDKANGAQAEFEAAIAGVNFIAEKFPLINILEKVK